MYKVTSYIFCRHTRSTTVRVEGRTFATMNAKTPVVQVKQGKVKGAVVKNLDGGEYLAFNGIPFAQPPIGELRFKDPLPPKLWEGIRSPETKFPKPCQYDLLLEYYTGTEDCLYLNVATRSLDGKRPVMFWIHGGGFCMGTASTDICGPDYIMQQDVVFVSVAFRVGCFGFLNLKLPEASGNQGMKDLVAGLKWVHENIEAFGGDPGNVTLTGQSAGAAAVHFLAVSPLTKGAGLFHKVIAQSGAATSGWTFSEKPVESGLRLAAAVVTSGNGGGGGGGPCNDPAEALKILMEATEDALLKAQRQITSKDMDFELVFDFIPSLDTASPSPFMPEHPRKMCERGINVPLIIGSTSHEGIMTTLNSGLEGVFREINTDFVAVLSRILKVNDHERVEKIAEDVKKYYFGEAKTVTTARNLKDFVRLAGDAHYYTGIRRAIEFQLDLPTPTYVYRFSHVPSYPTVGSTMNCKIQGASHGDELGVLLHNRGLMGNRGLQRGTRDYFVMKKVTRLWANFMRTGDSTVQVDDGAPTTAKWQPITRQLMNYLDITEELTPKVNYWGRPWKFWKPILDSL